MFKGASGFHAGESGGAPPVGTGGIYGGDGSVPNGTTATIGDTLTFADGNVVMGASANLLIGLNELQLVADKIYNDGSALWIEGHTGGVILVDEAGDEMEYSNGVGLSLTGSNGSFWLNTTTTDSLFQFTQANGTAFDGILGVIAGLTATRTWRLPDADGTIALVGGAGIDGIYGGSGSLGGDTVVTMTTNKLQFDSTTTTGLITIDASTDSVGIGTDTPTGTLELAAPNLNDNVTFELSQVGTRKWFIETDFATSGEPVHFKNNADDHLMSFLTTTREIGIGTSTPKTILHIAAPQSVGDFANATTLMLTNTSTGTDQTSDIRLTQRTGDYESGVIRGGREADYSSGSRDGYLSFLTGKDDGGGTVVLTQTMYMSSAGNIGIGSGFTPAALPDASALLDMSLSTTQGFLPPVMTTVQRDAINSGTFAEGLVVYDSTLNELQFYDGTSWVATGGGIYGGSGTIPSSVIATVTDEFTFSGGIVAINSTLSMGAGDEIQFSASGVITLIDTLEIKTGRVGIGGPPDASAILQADSTTQGFLPPRMTTLQRAGIVTPATGLIVYNTDTNQWEGNSGTPGTPVWVILG